MIAFGAVVGSTAFFIAHGFKQNAEQAERQILSGATPMSDVAIILSLEIIGAFRWKSVRAVRAAAAPVA